MIVDDIILYRSNFDVSQNILCQSFDTLYRIFISIYFYIMNACKQQTKSTLLIVYVCCCCCWCLVSYLIRSMYIYFVKIPGHAANTQTPLYSIYAVRILMFIYTYIIYLSDPRAYTHIYAPYYVYLSP